ncbi:arabinosidase [Arachidicoccus ginsenosidimutans]|uniref:glycoside hydrolase family 43 protein n=1 Tax=Arachidicoccus sp. BS20 TaxID=1850526 RepID=UPI0007F0A8C7|nr:glycoside hydrolase family 43 protein [Arachidicoccus sp. BS20]ANI89080.1 arabinosidase [Arachidicoccus sp. BS20]
MNLIKRKIAYFLVVPVLLQYSCASLSKNSGNSKYSAYLFVYFTGNDKKDESIHFALSKDAFHYIALNHDHPVISSAKISSTGGVRDPHILRGEKDSIFYMVATDMVSANGWNSNRALVMMKSKDLIHWKSSVVNIQTGYAGQENLLRVWAPQTIYDKKAGKYMVYFSMKHGNAPDKIYYAYANKDFSGFESEPKLLYQSPADGASIDADIIYFKRKYHLFYKTEGSHTLGIKTAVSTDLTGKYVLQDGYMQQTKEAVEGSCVFPLIDRSGFILMYDVYMKGKYQFTFSRDLAHFSVIDKSVSMDFHPRHGTIIPITEQEAERLEKEWGE